MRRAVFLSIGLLELVAAGLLVNLGLQVPTTEDVDKSFLSANRVTDRANSQVRLLRQQVEGFQRLELERLTDRLQAQTRAVTSILKAQTVDFDTVSAMRDALGEVAQGLSGLSKTLDPEAIGKLSSGLGETAAFLDQKVAPTAQQAADQLDQSTAALREDARHLALLLREAPPDLKAVREVYDSLARFRVGLEKMGAALKLQRLETMREGFQGLEDALQTSSEQVDRLAAYTYPAVSFAGLVPQIVQKSFWPDGGKVAEGMRKGAAGMAAAKKEMDAVAADLPTIRSSLTESCTMVDKLRESLGLALKYRDKVEPLLKDAPAHASRLAEDLPKIGSSLSQILRDTRRLKDIATGLRQAQKGMDQVVARWPEVRSTLARTASFLELTRDQLNQAVQHRHEYEAAMQETVQVADTFTALLPLITDQLEGRLYEEERTLSDLGQSLDEVSSALPAYARTASRLLETGRLLAWLVAVIVGLHGGYLMLTARMGRRYSV
jgi:uncharacterized phage infection (PIP) family protein YhgE